MTEANLPSTLLELLKPLQEDYFTQNNNNNNSNNKILENNSNPKQANTSSVGYGCYCLGSIVHTVISIRRKKENKNNQAVPFARVQEHKIQGWGFAGLYAGAIHPAGASWATWNWPPSQTNRKHWQLGQVERERAPLHEGMEFPCHGGGGAAEMLSLGSRGRWARVSLGHCVVASFSLCQKPSSIMTVWYHGMWPVV